MAENTPNSFLPLGNTTEALAGLHGKEKQLVVDTTKNTLVVMDGATLGGHPLAKEGTKIKSGSEDVIINDSTEATLAGDVTIKNKPWGVVLDGEFPTDEEELAALANRVPVGGSVYGLAPLGPEDAIPAPYNTEEIITESGTWEAPVDGDFEITVIGGGSGAHVGSNYLQGGFSGNYNRQLRHIKKGTKIQITIGSGGIGTDTESDYWGSPTVFGDISSDAKNTAIPGGKVFFTSAVNADAFGGGFGGAGAGQFNAKFYGGGGAARHTSENQIFFGNGAQGCVIIRWYDPRKDTSLSIGDQLVIDLYARLAALEVKVNEGGVYNDEILITESGDFVVPYTGDFDVTVIGGGAGGYVFSTGCISGNSGAIEKKIQRLDAGDTVSVVIGSGGIMVNDTTQAYNQQTYESRKGTDTLFGDIVAVGGGKQPSSKANIFTGSQQHLSGVQTVFNLNTNCALSRATYGGGGDAGYSNSTSYAFPGTQGCVILRGHNPNKN